MFLVPSSFGSPANRLAVSPFVILDWWNMEFVYRVCQFVTHTGSDLGDDRLMQSAGCPYQANNRRAVDLQVLRDPPREPDSRAGSDRVVLI